MKIIRVNMSTGTTAFENVPERWLALGGRGLTSTIVNEETPPLCNAIGPNNKLVIAPGLLTGTIAPSSGRLSFGGKSPLTGGIKESNAGGMSGQHLARLGIKAIIIEGAAPAGKLYKLILKKDSAELQEAPELSMINNYELVDKIVGSYGNKVSVISIGRAGEMLLSAASIAVTDMELRPTRHAGRGGLGAVMGSKGLKTIVVDPAGGEKVEVKNPEAFKVAQKQFLDGLRSHPVSSEGLPTYGTSVLVNVLNEAGGLPTRNFSSGRFEKAEMVSGEKAHEFMSGRANGNPTHGCHAGCVIKCSGIFTDEAGKFVSKAPEYETVWANGPNCGIQDLDAIARMDRIYDDIGMDTIDGGAAIAVAMEGGVIPFGDVEGALSLLKEIDAGTPLGRILGNGALITGKTFGVKHIPVVKGQALPAYDPRAVKGMGVTYATTTMGADHTAGYSVAANILGVGGSVNPLGTEGQVDLSRSLQIATAGLDSTGLCLFVAFAVLDQPQTFQAMIDMINAMFGLSLTADDVANLGKSILKVEREFNTKAGFTAADDRLPEFFQTEKLPPHNETFDIKPEELDKVFNF